MSEEEGVEDWKAWQLGEDAFGVGVDKKGEASV